MNNTEVNAGSIEFSDVQEYLQSRGWQRVKSKLDEIDVFRSERFEVRLPLTREFADYADGMQQAAERIAMAEGRAIDAVLVDLSRPRIDMLRFARQGQDTADGTLGLEDGALFLAGARRTLLASACAVERPGQRFFKRMGFKSAQTFLEQCRLGQTEHGSFVLTVLCPLDISVDERPHKTFGRQVVTRLVESVGQVVRSLRRGGIDEIVEQSQPVITANLCDALIEMMPTNESGDLRIRASLSPHLKAKQPEHSIQIDRDLFPRFEDLAAKLRPQDSAESNQFVGRVMDLHGVDNEDNQLEGDVTLQLQVEGELVRARCMLDPSEYRKAVDAHRDQRYVSVRGVLRRRSRNSFLESPSRLEVVS